MFKKFFGATLVLFALTIVTSFAATNVLCNTTVNSRYSTVKAYHYGNQINTSANYGGDLHGTTCVYVNDGKSQKGSCASYNTRTATATMNLIKIGDAHMHSYLDAIN